MSTLSTNPAHPIASSAAPSTRLLLSALGIPLLLSLFYLPTRYRPTGSKLRQLTIAITSCTLVFSVPMLCLVGQNKRILGPDVAMLGIILSWLAALGAAVKAVVGEVLKWQQGGRCRGCGRSRVGMGMDMGMKRFCDDCGVEGVMMRQAEM